ncbi:unnamed protein product [Ixodes pacificus]
MPQVIQTTRRSICKYLYNFVFFFDKKYLLTLFYEPYLKFQRKKKKWSRPLQRLLVLKCRHLCRNYCNMLPNLQANSGQEKATIAKFSVEVTLCKNKTRRRK